MRKNIFLILSYFGIVGKLTCTVLVGFTMGNTWIFFINSLFILLFWGAYEGGAYVVMIFVVALLWLGIIVSAILGIKIKKVRIPMCIMFAISAILDSVLTFIFSDPSTHPIVFSMSLLIVFVCAKAVYDIRKQSKNNIKNSVDVQD